MHRGVCGVAAGTRNAWSHSQAAWSSAKGVLGMCQDTSILETPVTFNQRGKFEEGAENKVQLESVKGSDRASLSL